MNCPFKYAYGIHISQPIRSCRDSFSYYDFLDIRLLLRRKLLTQEFLLVKLKSSLQKCYGRHHYILTIGIFLSQMPNANFSGAPEFILVFSGVRVARSIAFCRSMFVLFLSHSVFCPSIYGF